MKLSKVNILPCPGKITLRDLKKCKLSHIFFDTFFNIEKYLEHEQKDPFSLIRVRLNPDRMPQDVTQYLDLFFCRRSSGSRNCLVFKEMETYGQEVSDWEKYAGEEYDILVAEEAANDQCNDV